MTLSVYKNVIWCPISHLEYVIENSVASKTFNKILLTLLKIIWKGEIEKIFQGALLFQVLVSDKFERDGVWDELD
jgi:hypothetical protein